MHRKRPAEDAVDGPSKKVKKEEPGPDRAQLKKQSQLVFGIRDNLKKLDKRELQLLLEENEQEVPAGTERVRSAMEFKTCLF